MPFCVRSHNRKQCPPVYPLVHNHRGRWPQPDPKPALHHPTHPYIRTHLPNVSPYSHGGRRRSLSHGSRRRHVHFADQPIVIDLPTSPPTEPSSAIAPARSRYPSRTPAAGLPPQHAPTSPNSYPTTARQVPSAPAQSRSSPSVSAPAPAATSGLHGILTSFPPGLWDLRQNTRPEYHPQHQPRYPDPVFPSDRGRRSIKLLFRPCDRAELSWTATVKAASCGKRLTVDDVLRAISTELFRRSACRDRDVCEGHPCYVKARSAQRIRTRRGHTGRPHYDDALRNVDLYHADGGRGLYFEGLRPERLGDGEVVYLVKFGCA